MTRILGIDPGLRSTGWGVIDKVANRLSFVAAGTVSSHADDQLAQRLLSINRGLLELIELYQPQEVAIEETVVNRNPLSSLKLGHARGVAMLSAASSNLPVWEYASKSVKQAVTGTGSADKGQIKAMIKHLLPLCDTTNSDACDALAVAICHLNTNSFNIIVNASRRGLSC